VLSILSVGQPSYRSGSFRVEKSETTDDIYSAQRHLEEDVPNSPSPTFNMSSIDASCYMTPVACHVPSTATCFLPEPILQGLQSIPTTPGFSAFTRVVQAPVSTQPDAANSNNSPHKASFTLSYMNLQFSIF